MALNSFDARSADAGLFNPLRVHLDLLRRSWSRLAAITIAGVVVGAVLALVWPKYVRLMAFVEPSVVKGAPRIALDDFEAVSNSLAYASRVKSELNSDVSAWTLRNQFSVTLNGKILVIECRAADRETAQRLVDAVTRMVISDFSAPYARDVARQREFEAVLSRGIAGAEKDLENISRTLAELQRRPFGDRDALAVLLLQQRMDERQESLTGLHRELRDLRLALDVESHDARLAGPQLERTPDLLRRAIVFAAGAGGLALLLSIVWFFMRAWLMVERARAESQQVSVSA